jgi:hypothetical protein
MSLFLPFSCPSNLAILAILVNNKVRVPLERWVKAKAVYRREEIMDRLLDRTFEYARGLDIEACGDTPEEASLRVDYLRSSVEKYQPVPPEAQKWIRRIEPEFSTSFTTPTSFALHIQLKAAISASSQEQANARVDELCRDLAEYVMQLEKVNRVTSREDSKAHLSSVKIS